MAAARRLRGLCLVFAASSALKLPALRARRPAHAPAPAIFTADDARPIVLFDGECNLCNAGVNILLDYDACSRDGRGNLRVAALQSTVGRLLLSRLSAEQRARAVDSTSGEYSSIVVAGRDRAWVGSGAVLKIGRQLKAPLRWLAVLGWCVPWFARDFVYGQISRRRKRWFDEVVPAGDKRRRRDAAPAPAPPPPPPVVREPTPAGPRRMRRWYTRRWPNKA